MVDWSEIEALQAELAAACNEDVAQRLSERNCVELVMKLKELGLIDLYHTTNGKEYLTPEKLKKEVLQALVANGGRSTIAELAEELSVDFDLVENALDEIQSENGLIKHFGSFITPKYLDFLAEEVQQKMDQSGFISVAKLSQEYDFSGDFLFLHLESRLTATINPQKTGFYTEAYVRRLEARLRGYLSASMVPIQLKAFYTKNKQVDENLVQKILTKLLDQGRIKGRFVGRGEAATFVPQCYAEFQKKEIRTLIESTGIVSVEKLRKSIDLKNEKLVTDWMKENYPDFLKLSSHFVSPSFINDLSGEVESTLARDHVVDLYASIPDSLTSNDLEALVRHLSSRSQSVSDAQSLGSDWLIDEKFIEKTAALFDTIISERAEKAAAKKVVTVMTEDDFDKPKKSQKSKEEPSEIKEKTGGGGRGAREHKTKGKDKKRKKAEAAEAEKKETESGGALSEEEISLILQEQEIIENFDESTLQELVDILHPRLSETYQTMAKSIFTQKQQVKNDAKKTKKSRKEKEEIINNCYLKLRLAQKGLKNFEDPEQFEKFLMKTMGNDLINFIFCASSDNFDFESALSPNQKAKIMAECAEEAEIAQISLKELNQAKTIDDVLELAQEAVQNAAGMMIKTDKNREKSVLLDYTASLEESGKECSDLATALHLASAYLFSKNFKSILHFPGKLTPKVIDILKEKIDENLAETLSQAQEDVLKQLKGDNIDLQSNLETLRQIFT